MKLPVDFKREIENLFTDFGMTSQLDAFYEAQQNNSVHGLRANRQKIDPQLLQRWLNEIYPGQEFPLISWTGDGLIYPPELQPGNSPLYKAGLFYIQEPSAMLPAAVLAARPGERILDLCAAPGGKAVRIAADTNNEGLLWANDISADRTRSLLRNIEMGGYGNTIISNEKPAYLARYLENYFDAVMLDVPCSGSGMFRRDPSAIKSWYTYGTRDSVPVQRELLESAWKMLAPGGRMVYSTCTFSLEENEGNIAWFLEQCNDADLVPIPKPAGVSDGLALTGKMKLTARIWPHLATGEGHFCALLQKSSASAIKPADRNGILERRPADGAGEAEKEAFTVFCRRTLTGQGREYLERMLARGYLRLERDHLHLVTFPLPDNLRRRIKTGLFLGSIRRDRRGNCRFEPAHALIMHLREEHVRLLFSASAADQRISRYLRGETLQWDDFAGEWKDNEYGAVCLEYEGCKWPFGWVRTMPEPNLKNLYPAGWRQTR